jgi:Ni,Fe-hydrogenase III component G
MTEVYLDSPVSGVPTVTARLHESGCRLAAIFAEDRTAPEGRYYLYYVFEQPSERRYLLVRTPVAADNPVFPSLAAGIPAVNWQEREIQDWFGLAAEGHPNPRRVALHDNWPDVHPLLKSFPIDTVLPPFEGERHVYRPTLGEGVFQIPVGPVQRASSSRGISTSPSPANRSSTCNCGCSTSIRESRSASSSCR